MEQISIQEIEEGIANLRAAEAKLMSVFGFKPTKQTRGPRKAKRVAKANGHANGISDKQAKARKQQGRYLAVMRGLTPGKRSRVSQIRKRDGFTAAMKFAKSLQA